MLVVVPISVKFSKALRCSSALSHVWHQWLVWHLRYCLIHCSVLKVYVCSLESDQSTHMRLSPKFHKQLEVVTLANFSLFMVSSALFILLLFSILVLQLESCNFSYPKLLHPLCNCTCIRKKQSEKRERQEAMEILPLLLGPNIIWSERKILLPQSFRLWLALVVTTASVSKDCFGAEVQKNREKKKKEWWEFPYSPSFIKPELETSPGPFSAVLVLIFKFQTALNSSPEIQQERSDKLTTSWWSFEFSHSFPTCLLIFIFRVLRLLLHAFCPDFRLFSVGDIGCSMFTSSYPEVEGWSIDFST